MSQVQTPVDFQPVMKPQLDHVVVDADADLECGRRRENVDENGRDGVEVEQMDDEHGSGCRQLHGRGWVDLSLAERRARLRVEAERQLVIIALASKPIHNTLGPRRICDLNIRRRGDGKHAILLGQRRGRLWSGPPAVHRVLGQRKHKRKPWAQHLSLGRLLCALLAAAAWTFGGAIRGVRDGTSEACSLVVATRNLWSNSLASTPRPAVLALVRVVTVAKIMNELSQVPL